jgi:hypothetical protein
MPVKRNEVFDATAINNDPSRSAVDVGPAANALKIAVARQLNINSDVYGYKRYRMLVLLLAIRRYK